jgi:hypothetical protein
VGYHTVGLGAYGAVLEVVADDESLLEDLLAGVPRGWRPVPVSGPARWRFEIRRDLGELTTIGSTGDAVHWSDVTGARGALREELRRQVGFHSPDLFFVHAGVVAYREAVIVLPGSSFAGKSTLVRALVSAGAQFYSDEYAIFDRAGQVRQYREPLILRGANGREETEILAEGPDRPLPVGLLAAITYADGARWVPRSASVGEGVVALMEHASRARPRAAEAMATFRLALEGARVLVGERGDAAETAEALLDAAARRTRPAADA